MRLTDHGLVSRPAHARRAASFTAHWRNAMGVYDFRQVDGRPHTWRADIFARL